MTYYTDYETEPIGGGNPYYCCAHCGRSDPEINGQLDKHMSWCEYRQRKEAELARAADATAPAAPPTAKPKGLGCKTYK